MIIAILFFLISSCGSTKKIAKSNNLHTTYENNSTEKAISLGKTKDSKKTYFSKIPEEILKDVEMGTPQSLKKAVAILRKSEENLDEVENTLISVITNILQIVYPSERILWEIPEITEETSYSGAINSALNGIYDTSTGNVDFLTNLLPSLVVLKVENVSTFYDYAKSDLQNALNLNSQSFLAYYLLSILEFKEKNYESAVENAQKAQVFYNESENLAEIISKSYNFLGKFKESNETALQNLKKFPNNIELLTICAKNSFELKIYDKAEDYIAQVLIQQPNNLEALLFRAKVLIQTKNYIRASSLLDMYSKQEQNSKEYLILRSQLQFEWSKNTTEAISTIEKALSLYPNDFEILLYAAKLSNESLSEINGKPLNYYAERILNTQSENEDAQKYAINGYIHQKEFEKAYPISKKIISNSKNSQDILNFTNICIELNKTEEAFQTILPLFKQNPKDENFIQSYISVIIAQKKYNEALSLISELIQTSSVKLKSFLYYKKSFLEKSEEKTFSDLRSSLISNPRNIDSLFRLYEIYYSKKDYRKAQYYLRQIVALNPNNAYYKSLNENLSELIK